VDLGVASSGVSVEREQRDVAKRTLDRKTIPRTNKTVITQEAAAGIQYQCGRVSRGSVAFWT
jgi:hypothetical protein